MNSPVDDYELIQEKVVLVVAFLLVFCCCLFGFFFNRLKSGERKEQQDM